MNARGYIYILANKPRGTTYIGVTNNLARRLSEHSNGIGSAFVAKYRLRMLIYIELFDRIDEAIVREKQLKEWRRAWKWELIEKANPDWDDLSSNVHDWS